MLCWILLLTFQFQMCGKIIIDMRTKCKQRRYSIQGIIEMICGEHYFWLLPLASQATAVIVKIEQARNKEPSFRHRLLKAKTMLLLSHNRSIFSCPHCNMFRDWIGCFFNWLFFFLISKSISRLTGATVWSSLAMMHNQPSVSYNYLNHISFGL